MRPPSPSIPEKEFLLASIQLSLRLDGRLPLEMRVPRITFGEEFGFVECELGKTRVLAQVDAKMVKPPPERPFEGIISIHSELSPMAAPEFEAGRPSEEEVTLTRMLDKVLRRSDAIDKESLCIQAGLRVWHLRLTIHILSDSGNTLDCACLAGITALKHFRRPEVEVVGDEVTLHPPEERAPLELAVNHTPFCLTFAFFNPATYTKSNTTGIGKSDPSAPPPPPTTTTTAAAAATGIDASANAATPPLVILDPTTLEQRLSSGLIHIALNAQREICVIQKMGGIPQGVEDVLGVVEIAVGKVRELDQMVEERLRDDWEGRRGGVEVR